MNTQNQKVDYFYSQEVMDVATQKAIINLGKKIIKELCLDNSVDTLSRWMIFYISEKIIKLEEAPVDKREQLQKQCCDLILKTWSYRTSRNSIVNPFKNFEPVFEVLSSLNLDEDVLFYSRKYKQILDKASSPEQKYWLELIQELDQVVKVWMRYFAYNAAIDLVDNDVKDWLTAVDNISDIESDLLKQILSFEEDDKFRENKKQSLKRDLEVLEKFNEINERLMEAINKELTE